MFKLFGDKKKSKKTGYFLELKEDTDNAPVVEKVETSVVEAAEKNGKNGKSQKTPVALKGKKGKSETVKQPQPAPVVTKAEVKEEPKQVNFATDYLLTQTSSRRLPGPSLNNFKQMAREIKK